MSSSPRTLLVSRTDPNQYTYVQQNPWTKFDPEGLNAELVVRDQADYDSVMKMKKSGVPLYKNVNVVKGFDKDGNPSKDWALAQRATGTIGADGHKYDSGKFAGTSGIWFFDNKASQDIVTGLFHGASWTGILLQTEYVGMTAGVSGLGAGSDSPNGELPSNSVPKEPTATAKTNLADSQAASTSATVSKQDRLGMVFDNLSKAPAAKNAEGAMQQMNTNLDQVENAYSGAAKVDPAPKSGPRMYPAEEDNIVRSADGTITATSKGHVTTYGADGSITVRDNSGNVVFHKAGGG